MPTRPLTVILSALALAAPSPLVVAAPAGAADPCWSPAVVGVVIDPFRAPACPYCSGNRGLEYRVGGDAVVRAVAAGQVSWSGRIGGVRYVVVRHVDGWRVTYGRLASSHLHTGDRVLVGSRIGRASGEFYFGVRIGSDYVDPAPFLGRWERRPRLVPVDGTPSRPAPPGVLRCGPAVRR